MEITSFRDPPFPETSKVEFVRCAYQAEAGGHLNFVAASTAPRLAPASYAGSPARSKMKPSASQPVRPAAEHFLSVHVFWKPFPGRTFSEPTMLDAVVRYVIATPGGTATYSGAGFATPKRQKHGMTLELERSDLRLTAVSGTPPDSLGAIRLRGRLVAADDSAAAVSLMRQVELLSAGSVRP